MPAERAGLESGDTIAAVNGVSVTSQAELQFRIAAALADRKTELTIRRNDRLLPPVTISLVKSRNPLPFLATKQPEPVFGLRVDHWSTLMQDLMQNDRDATSRIVPQGVVIASIEDDSPASRRFRELNRRYVITAVDGRPVRHPAEFERATAGAKSVRLSVARVGDATGRTFEVVLP
jgi:S1-C subfamily serine protease